MAAPTSGEEWIELTADELPIAAMYEWAVRPDCGAVVLFSGTVRDHADGRTDVTSLEYEAYDEAVIPVFESIAAEIRQTYSGVGRIVLVHRTGTLEVGESSVVVAVSSAHRPSAFEAARYAIDALKERAPIWKKENWAGGTDWGTGAHDIVAPNKVAGNAS